MSEIKHTVGPWFIDRVGQYNEDDGCNFIVDNYNNEICQFFSKQEHSYNNNIANAKLIAAAPEMLRYLEIMTSLVRIKYGNLDKDVYEQILKAEAVIKKATE